MSCDSSDRSGLIFDVQNLQNALNSLADAVACEHVCLPISRCIEKAQDVPVLFLGSKSSGKSSLMNTLLFDDCDSLALTPDTLMCTSVRSASKRRIDGQTYESNGKFDSDLQERLKRGPPKNSREVEEPQVVDVTISFSDQSLCFDTCSDTSNTARFLDTPSITDDEASLAGLKKMIQRLSHEGPAPILVCCVPICGLRSRDRDHPISAELKKLLTSVDDLADSRLPGERDNQIIFVGTGYDELVKKQNAIALRNGAQEKPARRMKSDATQRAMADEIFTEWSNDVKEMFPGAIVVRFARYGASVSDNKDIVPDDTRCELIAQIRVEISKAIKRAHSGSIPTIARHISDAAWEDLRRLDFYHRLHSRTSGIEDFVPVPSETVKKLIGDALSKYDEHCRNCLHPSLRALVKRKAETQRQEQDGKWCGTQGKYQRAVMKSVSSEIDRLVKKEMAAAKKLAVQTLETGLTQGIRKTCREFDGELLVEGDVKEEATLIISAGGCCPGAVREVKTAGALVATGFGIRLSVIAGPLLWKLSGGALAVVSAATSIYSKYMWKYEKVDEAMINGLENDIKTSVWQERQALNKSLEALVGCWSTALSASRSQELTNIVNLINQIDAYYATPEEGRCLKTYPEAMNKDFHVDTPPHTLSNCSLTSAPPAVCEERATSCKNFWSLTSCLGMKIDPLPRSLTQAKASFTFRRRICIQSCSDTTEQRPEFQVEWWSTGPIVVCVKPGSEAERLGMLAGDSIDLLNGIKAAGKMRDELLQQLKDRPLTLDLNQSACVDSKYPHIEVKASFPVSGDLGMDISWGGSLPVVGAVREGSLAWNEGVFVGDAIYAVNGLEASAAHQTILTALQQRPLTLTLWRRPIGVDITAPWREYLQAQSLRGPTKKRVVDAIAAQGSFTYRRRVCFDKTVNQADCEIEWQDPMPVVTSVKPSGGADQRGVVVGDRIALMNGASVMGKTRQDVLPKLKERPLTLEFDRTTHSGSKHPLAEVNVQFDDAAGDLGMDISWEDSLPVVCAVRKGSAAWTEGAFVGDAIHSVNDLAATAGHHFILTALQQRPLKLTLWRRPYGADINASWKEYLRPVPDKSFQMTRCEELEEVIAAQRAELAANDIQSAHAIQAARELALESTRKSELKYNELVEQLLDQQKQMSKQKEQMQAVKTAVLSLNKRLLNVLDGQVVKSQQEQPVISNSSEEPYIPAEEAEADPKSQEEKPGTKEATRAAISKLATATVLLKYCKHSFHAAENPQQKTMQKSSSIESTGSMESSPCSTVQTSVAASPIPGCRTQEAVATSPAPQMDCFVVNTPQRGRLARAGFMNTGVEGA